MTMKRNLEVEEIQGTINALVDTGRAMVTSLKNPAIMAIIIKKRKAIVTVVSERARKKSLTKTNGITKQNSTGVEINLQGQYSFVHITQQYFLLIQISHLTPIRNPRVRSEPIDPIATEALRYLSNSSSSALCPW